MIMRVGLLHMYSEYCMSSARRSVVVLSLVFYWCLMYRTWIMSHVMHASTGVDARVQALDSLVPYLQANAALR